jgi:hypothetical protein
LILGLTAKIFDKWIYHWSWHSLLITSEVLKDILLFLNAEKSIGKTEVILRITYHLLRKISIYKNTKVAHVHKGLSTRLAIYPLLRFETLF